VFDRIAPKLAELSHVYGVTRRGFGISDAPASGYSIDALAEDVLDIIGGLHLVKPIVVGHSIAGDEMTTLASRHPDRIGALVYLDAAYDRSSTKNLPEQEKVELSKRYGKSAAIWLEIKENTPRPDYAPIKAPAMAIFGGWPFPPEIQSIKDEIEKREAERSWMERRADRIREFQAGMPSAHVVDLPSADHYVFLSHEAEVLREIRDFLARLQ
jgi:non-heme chloroperoxidase